MFNWIKNTWSKVRGFLGIGTSTTAQNPNTTAASAPTPPKTPSKEQRQTLNQAKELSSNLSKTSQELKKITASLEVNSSIRRDNAKISTTIKNNNAEIEKTREALKQKAAALPGSMTTEQRQESLKPLARNIVRLKNQNTELEQIQSNQRAIKRIINQKANKLSNSATRLNKTIKTATSSLTPTSTPKVTGAGKNQGKKR